MFEPKNSEKLHSTSPMLYQNKLVLDELCVFNPFEFVNLEGLKVLHYPEFEEIYKVLQSLQVADDNGVYLPSQTNSLKEDILKTSKQETFIELLYQPVTPQEATYRNILMEKLYLNLVNLVLETELPKDRSLSVQEIELAKKTFKEMLASA